jgi:hypothetical protein
VVTPIPTKQPSATRLGSASWSMCSTSEGLIMGVAGMGVARPNFLMPR